MRNMDKIKHIIIDALPRLIALIIVVGILMAVIYYFDKTITFFQLIVITYLADILGKLNK